MKKIAFRLWLSLCGFIFFSMLTLSFFPREEDINVSFIAAGTFLFLSAFSLWGVWLVGATETVLQYQRHFWLGLSISFWPPAILWGLAAFALPYSFGTQAIILSLALFPFAATAYIVRQTIRRKPLWPIVLMTQ